MTTRKLSLGLVILESSRRWVVPAGSKGVQVMKSFIESSTEASFRIALERDITIKF